MDNIGDKDNRCITLKKYFEECEKINLYILGEKETELRYDYIKKMIKEYC